MGLSQPDMADLNASTTFLGSLSQPVLEDNDVSPLVCWLELGVYLLLDELFSKAHSGFAYAWPQSILF